MLGAAEAIGVLKASSAKTKILAKTFVFARILWQGHKDLNPEPTVLETAALPIELYPYISLWSIMKKWWAFGDSNPGPTGYEPVALTN